MELCYPVGNFFTPDLMGSLDMMVQGVSDTFTENLETFISGLKKILLEALISAYSSSPLGGVTSQSSLATGGETLSPG